MACSNCNCSDNKCGCKDAPLTTAPTYTCPPDIKCPDPTPCYETIQDTCVKHSLDYSIYQFGNWFGNETSYPILAAGASLENAYQAMSVRNVNTDCLPPINVHPSYIGTTAIILNWEDTGANTYTLQYGTTPGVWTTVSDLLVPTYTLTVLNPNTNYYFQVISNCNETETSSTGAIIVVKTLSA